MAINPGISGCTSWIVDIEVLGLGSRILCPGSSFQTMPEKKGKTRKSLCLTIPKLSISSSYFLLKCHSLYILEFPGIPYFGLSNEIKTLKIFQDFQQHKSQGVPFFCFLNNIRPQPYPSPTLFQHFQQYKTAAIHYFRVFK